MKIIVDIPEAIYIDADHLVQEGKYSSFSLFAEVALKNQLVLEGKTDNEIFDITSKKPGKHKIDVSPGTKTDEINLEINAEFKGMLIPAPSFKDIDVFGFEKPENILIWGQINKLFPVKFLLRYFVSNYYDQQEVSFEEFKTKSTEAARQFGKVLLEIDESRSARRDERISIGFPLGEEGKDRFKSDSRFGSQLIGYIRKSGKMSGALLEMRFASVIENNDKYVIGITKSGLEFANLKNPIIDEGDSNRVLTEKETRFYISHCKECLPGEYMAMRALAAFISSGKTSRTKLNMALKEMISNWKSWKNEDDLISFVDTERSGLTSRLFESQLLEKKRTGNMVQYLLSPLGEQLLL